MSAVSVAVAVAVANIVTEILFLKSREAICSTDMSRKRPHQRYCLTVYSLMCMVSLC
jgi:hypothetical protein